MKYLKCYEPEWDEVFQVEFNDDDPTITKMPANMVDSLSGEPFADIPIRSRSRAEADKQRQADRQ